MTLDTPSAPVDDEVCDATVDDAEHGAQEPDDQEKPSETPTLTRNDSKRLGLVAGLLLVVVLAGLAGWLGLRYSHLHHDQQERALFLQVARQGALNLTTINHTQVEADVQRILDSSTGAFHDDFRNRSQPFIDVVKKAQSTTEGSITEAALESMNGDTACVLVAVSVKTTNSGVAEQESRSWRMRIDVQKVGDSAKVSNVQFVP